MTTKVEFNLAELRERYTADEVPPCRVCGGKLSIASMGGGAATKWACSVVKPIQTKEWDHYRDSQWTQYKMGDSQVLALIDAYEELVEGRVTV